MRIDDIKKELIVSMKAKDQDTILVLRSLMSEIKNKKIELKVEDLEDTVIGAIVKKMIKQRKDSIASFVEGGREELVENEKVQIAILEKYLPEEMPDSEIEPLVQEAIVEVGAEGMQDMGKVMGVAMQKVAGKADGNKVKEIVQKKLQG